MADRCFSVDSRDHASVKQTTRTPPVMPTFNYVPPPYDGPSAEEILALRRKYLFPSVTPYYKKPLNLVDGKQQYVFDEHGKRYLDAYGGVSVVTCGHCHPVVEEAIIKQMKLIQHTTVLYLNRAITDYAQALAAKMPGDLKVMFFANSGSEACELAILLARLYTGRSDIISLRNSYHGITPESMGATGNSEYKFNVVQTGIHHAMCPDHYRGAFGSDDEKYANDVESLINYATPGKVAGFISEAIQGVGGIIEPGPSYFPAVYESVRKAGGVCIADEVISGFGRTGSHFWAFEAHGVIPDIVTMAKGIGNGTPISAVVTTPEIAQSLTGHSFGSTFGSNEISTTAGLATLRVIEKENLQENAHEVGTYLKERLTELQNKHEIIGDVRGRGFILGIDFVTDRKLKTPATEEAAFIMEEMKDMGVLVGKSGFYGNVLRLFPPLCFTYLDADYLVDVLDYVLWKMNL